MSPFARFPLSLAAAATACLCLSAPAAFAQPVQASFEGIEQIVSEGDTVEVDIVLDQASFFPMDVSYSVSGTSTATAGDDYEIAEGFESPITIEAGQTRVPIRINVLADEVDEGSTFETIRLTLDDGGGVAELAEPTTYTINIRDSGTLKLTWTRVTSRTSEENNISATVSLNTVSDKEIRVPFSISAGTATIDSDYSIGDDATTKTPLIIPAGTDSANIIVKVINDAIIDADESGGAEEETVFIDLGQAVFDDGSSGTILTDDRTFTGVIRDNDPITVDWRLFEGQPEARVEEHFDAILEVELSAPSESEVRVPVSFGGTATFGEDENSGDYTSQTEDLTFEAGNEEGRFTLAIRNDSEIEDDETIIVTLGTPEIEGGGATAPGENTTFTVTIQDNDPVRVNFGRVNPADPAETPFDVVPPFLVDDGQVIAEADEEHTFAVFADGRSEEEISFDFSVVGSGTTATFFNPDTPDAHWDFFLQLTGASLGAVDQPVRLTIPGGGSSSIIRVGLNNDREDPVIFGQSPPESVEGDETITFRIENLSSADSTAAFGDAIEYTLTIKELPDIDISALVGSLVPTVAGDIGLNPVSGLFDVPYRFELTQALDPADFAGYRSFKVRFRPVRYDIENPDSPDSDTPVKNPQNPAFNQPFEFQLRYPVFPRFNAGTDRILLVEGEPQSSDESFIDRNADIVELAPFILRRLDLPPLDPVDAERNTPWSINDPMDFLVEFTNGGFANFPRERFDPAVDPDAVGIFLSRADSQPSSSGNGILPIRLTEQPDGTMLMEINTSNTNAIEIQYWDGVGDSWKSVMPSRINTPGSRLFFFDTGPPKTDTPSSATDMRLYRILER